MPLTSSGGDRREIDVDQRARRDCRTSSSGASTRSAQAFGGGERHRVAHALARIGLAERDRAHAGERALHRRRHRARISDVLGEIGAAVDARQDEVGRRVLHHVGQRQHHRVGRRAGDREARSPWRRRRTGSVRVSEWPAPDCSSVGATTQMSSDELARDRLRAARRPRAFTPSSLVSRMRIARRYGRACRNAATATGELRHIRNMLGDFFTGASVSSC